MTLATKVPSKLIYFRILLTGTRQLPVCGFRYAVVHIYAQLIDKAPFMQICKAWTLTMLPLKKIKVVAYTMKSIMVKLIQVSL